MKEELISFGTAKLAQDKGFKVPTWYYYEDCGEVWTYGSLMDWSDTINSGDRRWNAATQSLLQRWLREEYGYYVIIIPTITSDWTFKILKVISKIDNDVLKGLKSVSDLPPYKEVSGIDFSTYEKALETGLLEGLKLIK